ncbi:DUF2335 domain-containing protein [Staphylococcus pettenkoferi]|uniref:DUF2335 domain-containing protein n=1 Tax=Staphylococcus pettenkoferi TaxID=170573 RepID=UPI00066B0A9D|nr:DUF2335 domain-containing protein [Staphylococcus pettenkoferi]MDK7115611.1 DUF2335 domain-containing protein [Staphylococcus pettenkoferi]MDK7284255.1 DUF2335 domain-containing protein [Staphylococcus pettenkoferi]
MTNKENNIHDLDIVKTAKQAIVQEKENQEMIATLEMYNGPIPHPKVLEGYDKLDPGSAKRIINNGIEESKHRRKMEVITLKYITRSFYFRFILAFILAILFGLGSFYLVLNNHPIIGSTFLGATLISIVIIFTGEILNPKSD